MTDRIGGIVEAVRLRLEEELRQQLAALTAEHERALDAALAEAGRAAEQEAQATESRHLSELDAARAAAEQATAAAVASVRSELERERQAERQTSGDVARTLTDTIAALDRCGSLTEVLNLAARTTAGTAGGLFVVSQGSLKPWATTGELPGSSSGELASAALRDQGARTDEGQIAVPLMLDGSPVGVLVGPAADEARLELLAAAIASRLAAVTALRLVQAHRWSGVSMAPPVPAEPVAPSSQPARVDDDPAASARRYARLLISEIQLYNEDAVRDGRQQRDLRTRLGPEIDRARQIYETRVPADLPGRSAFFHEELVRTLANGDASLLA